MQIKQVTLFLIFSILILLLIIPGFANAHKVIIFAWVEDGIIRSESNFGSKRAAKNCKINVVTAKGEKILTGMTDKNGEFSFKIPEKINSDIILNLDAGQGHKAYWKILANELEIPHLNEDLQNKMKIKQKLEQKPSAYKIISGIGIIFFLGMVLKFFKKKRHIKNND